MPIEMTVQHIFNPADWSALIHASALAVLGIVAALVVHKVLFSIIGRLVRLSPRSVPSPPMAGP